MDILDRLRLPSLPAQVGWATLGQRPAALVPQSNHGGLLPRLGDGDTEFAAPRPALPWVIHNPPWRARGRPPTAVLEQALTGP